MCWEERSNEGIVYRQIHYTPPGGVQKLVLFQANLAQIHVPYDNNAARFHDVSDYGLGGGNLNNLAAADCPGGVRLLNNGKNVVCRAVTKEGYAYKHYGVSKQASALTLFSVSHVGQYNYIPQWKFMDDGSILPSVGATGKLQLCTSDPQYGWLINATTCPRGTSHVHNYYWYLDFDLDGAGNDQLEQLGFAGSGADLRPIAITPFNVEAARASAPAEFRHWRVKDKVIANADGHKISYDLEPESSHLHRGPAYEPWTRNDLYYTQHKSCERYVSHNPTANGTCAENAAAFVNGETVSDAVLWYGISFHHVPRDEDEPFMSAHWSGFRIVPHDMTATNPR